MSKLINNITEVFNETLKGGLIITGNTCSVIGEHSDNVRQFIKPNGDYTSNWHESGSNAFLELPKGSVIKYAVLEWHSTVANSNSDEFKSESYSPIIFKTPSKSFTISINNYALSEAQYREGPNTVHSVKWADVTAFMDNSESGIYTVQGIPTAFPFENSNTFKDHDQRLGWSLSVVYENHNMPTRHIMINMGIKKQDYSIPREDSAVTLSGFKALSYPNKAYLTIVAMNGNPNFQSGLSIYKDISLINEIKPKYSLGNSASCLFEDPKTKPIVPYDNIFSGIIMNTNTESFEYGELETRGTLGTKNNTPYIISNNLNFMGNRGKLDILSFDISKKLENEQNSLIIVSDIFDENKGDSLEIITYALQIDVEEDLLHDIETQATSNLDITISKTSIRKVVRLDEPFEYTIDISNASAVNLTNVFLMDYLPINASFIKNSLIVDGGVSNGNIFSASGLNIGNIPAGQSKVIKYQISFYDLPVTNPVKMLPKLKYSYLSNGTSIEESLIGISSSINVIKSPLGRVELYSNKTTVISGEKILYSLIIKNNGAVPATNVNLKDVLPQGLTYVQNSLMVNGTALAGDINVGVTLPNIPVGKEFLVTFEALNN